MDNRAIIHIRKSNNYIKLDVIFKSLILFTLTTRKFKMQEIYPILLRKLNMYEIKELRIPKKTSILFNNLKNSYLSK